MALSRCDRSDRRDNPTTVDFTGGAVSTSSLCSYCKNGSATSLYKTASDQFGVFSLLKCCECGAVFLSPKPSPETLDEAYQETYFGARTEKFGKPVEFILDIFRRARAGKVTRLIPPRSKILDVGCGNGRFLDYLNKRGYRCCGVEMPGKAAERAQRIPGVNIKVGRIEELGLDDEQYDMITLWHVFEHTTQPRQTLDTLCRIIRPDGFLAISMPNIHSWQARVFKGFWFHLDPPRHVFFLGPQELTQLLQKKGFRVISKSFFSIEHNPFGMQQSCLNLLGGRRDALFEAFKGNPGIFSSTPALKVQALLCLLTVPLFVILSILETCFGAGGTFEMIFQKKGLQVSPPEQKTD